MVRKQQNREEHLAGGEQRDVGDSFLVDYSTPPQFDKGSTGLRSPC